ncbi:MAG: hypothetical protein IJA55_04395 [Clostridia bacterium]|nr:hypothetical protein [Clostridia bacterium]
MRTIDKVRIITESYSEQLAQKGIACKVTKKYFETKTSPVYTGLRRGLINLIDEYISRKKEKKYSNQPNTHHCIIIKFYPIDSYDPKMQNCKEYSFILSQKWRAHIGDEPMLINRDEEILLTKIKRRIRKMINKATHSSPERTCKNCIIDIIRYLFSSKYGYMKNIAGKERSTVEIIAMFGILGIVMFILLIITMIF